jgi:hypothetical protein
LKLSNSHANTIDFIASKWKAALAFCFGTMFRSKLLGSRHIDKGIYIDQLQRWWLNFPRSNFHLLTLEQWSKDPEYEYDRILDFLNISSLSSKLEPSTDSNNVKVTSQNQQQKSVTTFAKSHQKYNYNINFTKKRLVSPNNLSQYSSRNKSEIKSVLREFYAKYNKRLYHVLGASFSFND